MSMRAHILSFVGGGFAASVTVAAVVAVGGIGVAAGVAFGGAAVVAFGVAFGRSPKPGSYIAGLFTGFAAAGGLAYALQADPAEAAKPDVAAPALTQESHGGKLAAEFEGTNGSRIELVMPETLNAPGAPAYGHLTPAP